jgi:hypothetical protein
MALMLLGCLVFISLCKAFRGYTVSCPSDPSLPSNTSAVGNAELPVVYSKVGYPQDPTIIEKIRNTLALYPLAVDGKDFGALDLVFTQDVVANYSAPLNELSPLSTLKSEVQENLAYVTTQHKLSTQVIEVMPSGYEAKSLTYIEATLFGQGHYEGQVCMLVSGRKPSFQTLKQQRANNVASRSAPHTLSQFIPDLSIFSRAIHELDSMFEKDALQTMPRSISRVIIAANSGTYRYHDYWIQQPTRQWRIVARTVTYMVRRHYAMPSAKMKLNLSSILGSIDRKSCDLPAKLEIFVRGSASGERGTDLRLVALPSSACAGC